MLFGAASFLGFIPYIIVFMIKSFQVLMQHKYCLHWNKCTYYDCIYIIIQFILFRLVTV